LTDLQEVRRLRLYQRFRMRERTLFVHTNRTDHSSSKTHFTPDSHESFPAKSQNDSLPVVRYPQHICTLIKSNQKTEAEQRSPQPDLARPNPKNHIHKRCPRLHHGLIALPECREINDESPCYRRCITATCKSHGIFGRHCNSISILDCSK
jgi:hypothetical protein